MGVCLIGGGWIVGCIGEIGEGCIMELDGGVGGVG